MKYYKPTIYSFRNYPIGFGVRSLLDSNCPIAILLTDLFRFKTLYWNAHYEFQDSVETRG